MSHNVKLLYLGKKKNLELKMPTLRGKYVFNAGGEPLDVDYVDADWLIATNPKMFRKVDADYKPKPVVEKKPKPLFVCEKCGADFTIQRFYDDHVAECPDWKEVDGRFQCMLCDKGPYSDWEWFSKHMQSKHDIDLTTPEGSDE